MLFIKLFEKVNSNDLDLPYDSQSPFSKKGLGNISIVTYSSRTILYHHPSVSSVTWIYESPLDSPCHVPRVCLTLSLPFACRPSFSWLRSLFILFYQCLLIFLLSPFETMLTSKSLLSPFLSFFFSLLCFSCFS